MLTEMLNGTKENETKTEEKALITGDMLIGDILFQYPESAYILMNCGMGCISCPSAQMESLYEACDVHGIDGDEVIRYLNVELGLEELD